MPWLLFVLFLSLLGGWHWFTTERPVRHPPGILVPEEPRQRDLDAAPPFAWRGHAFTKRARYDITARVLRKEIYRIDGGAGLAPVDLGVGWGPMSDSAIIDQLDFEQMGRFFFWRPRDAARFPLAMDAIAVNAAQMHMVPSSTDLESRLKDLRPGQIVTVGGYLVDIRGPGGFTWNTSQSRTDTGAGACEIVWVETLEVR